MEALREEGWHIEETTDYGQVLEIGASFGKTVFTPMMNPKFNDFTYRNSIWHVASIDGEPVALLGARLDELGSEDLGAYLGRQMVRAYPPAKDEELWFSAPHVAQQLTGKLAYIGELFLSEKVRGKRMNLRHFLMLMHSTVALKWAPDWHYAFMADRHVSLGMDSIYWFTHRWPGVITWPDPPKGRGEKEWLVALEGADVETIVKYYMNLGNG